MNYINRFLINQNYDRRSYIFDKDYTEQMDIRQINRLKTPDQVAYEKSITKHSEVKKPWQNDDYQEMEYCDDLPKGGIRIPKPIPPPILPPESPPDEKRFSPVPNWLTVWLDQPAVYPTWAAVHNANTGTDIQYLSSSAYFQIYVFFEEHIGRDDEYYIKRAFLTFDLTNAFSGTLTAVKFKYWIADVYSPFKAAIIQQGSQGKHVTVVDYNAFSGSLFANLTTVNGWNTVDLNATGIAYVQACIGNAAQFCIRDTTYDYNNVAPPVTGDFALLVFGKYNQKAYAPELELIY